MTIIPVYKICSKCKRKFLWNPDIGRMWCEYCGTMGTPGAGDIPWKDTEEIIKIKKKKIW